MLNGALLTSAALFCLLVAEYRESQLGVWLFKPLASVGFLLIAWTAPKRSTPYGRALLPSLVLCLAGDIFLIPESGWYFKLGLVAFSLAHVGFIIAFARRPILPAIWFLQLYSGLVFPAAAFLWWLLPHLEDDMMIPVMCYTSVITLMLTVALVGWLRHVLPGRNGPLGPQSNMVFVGAVLFYFSDMFVAREQFVVHSFWNKFIGLPLYYGAQVLLASSLWL